jgi:tetratricopeptide (TPR) repeat protein
MAAREQKYGLIEEAQKFASRGQFDKAVKAYERIIALEPAVIGHHQKMAELLIKCSRNDDARKELETVANHFSKNGFYSKAIAVYKQLQKLFPTDISLSLALAELNEKHGLVANAVAEYKLVYEQLEQTGKIPEALNILDRMQSVDPQNVAIKLELAEASARHWKNAEAFDVFSTAAVLLLERNDGQTLAKVCARVQLLFPEKPEFLFEVLSELIRSGNAAAAISSLQSLLRNDPHNKALWELIIQAYQLLNQPQRVKTAYLHFLKYFPAEPAALMGLISSIIAEQNLSAALEMLTKYEATLVSGGFIPQLEQAYQALDALDPINVKVIEGLIRVATAAGNESETASLTSRLEPLRNVSRGAPAVPPELERAAVLSQAEPPGTDMVDTMPTTEPRTEEDADSDLEIDIEFDDDSLFGASGEECDNSSPDENWLDSVVALLDSADATPRGVKFGVEMDNSDARSHFDLGQAFKEMGLFNEALNELRLASQDLTLRLESLILQCACLRESGQVARSITILRALLENRLSQKESCSVKLELATGLEAAGKTEEAHALLEEINSLIPGFLDVDSLPSMVNTLDALDFSDDDLDDF